MFEKMEQFAEQQHQQHHLQQQGEKARRKPLYPRELARKNISVLDTLGKGAFGVVCKATLRENKMTAAYLVAVKLLHEERAEDKRELLEEAAVLAQFQHPQVVQLVGVVTAGSPSMMVVEYMEHGSLGQWLKGETDRRVGIGWRLVWACDVAAGLAHVHGRGFCHRDLAARNVLLSSDFRAKLSDFGMARDVQEGDRAYYRSQGNKIPVRWTAPEALATRKFTAVTDVWSFGVLMHEIWTQAATPYGDWSNMQVWVAVTEGYVMPRAEGCPESVYGVMKDGCWALKPDVRWTAGKVREALRGVLAASLGVEYQGGEGTGVETEAALTQMEKLVAAVKRMEKSPGMGSSSQWRPAMKSSASVYADTTRSGSESTVTSGGNLSRRRQTRLPNEYEYAEDVGPTTEAAVSGEVGRET
jgi:serine/threonine protein kinase